MLFHGSATFGTKDDPKTWTFGAEEGHRQGSPLSSLGHFFAETHEEAVGYSKGTGNVHKFYIRMENPLRISSTSREILKNTLRHDSAAAFVKRKQLQGYDGIYFTDQRHYIIFDPNQAKSVDYNNGEYSRDNNDTRHSERDIFDEARGGRYFRDDRALLAITGDFFSRGNRMVSNRLSEAEVREVFQLFAQRGNTWFIDDIGLKEARDIVFADTRNSETAPFTPADVMAELRAELGDGIDALIEAGAGWCWPEKREGLRG